MKRRILSIFTCLCMTLCLLPMTALADGATDFDIWVGGVRVTSANAGNITGPGITGTVSYNAASSTLTLSGASVTGAYTDNSSNTYGIYASGIDLTVKLVGVNTIIGADSGGDSYGVYCPGALAINGTGSLTATGGKASGTSSGVSGDSITVSDGASVTAIAGTAGRSCGTYGNSVTVAGVLTATAGSSTSISCGVFCANGSVIVQATGALTATGGAAANSYGVAINNGSITISGTVTATGGKATGTSDGVYSNTINVNQGSGSGLLIAKSGSAATSSAANVAPTCGAGSAALTGVTDGAIGKFAVWGVSGTYPTANILTSTLNLSSWNNDATSHWDNTTGGWKTETVNGVKTLTLENVIINPLDVTDSDAYGIKLPSDVNVVLEGVNVVSAGAATVSSYGVYSGGGVTISSKGGGALYALAGTANSGVSCGVYSSSSLSISGTVTVIGGTADIVSCGACSNSLNLPGTVTAIGGAADYVSSGLYDNSGSGTISLSGTITAIGGTATNLSSCGVYSNGAISVTGGTVTATGGAASGDSAGDDSAIGDLGSYGMNGGFVTLSSGTVTATGGAASGALGVSCGVFSKNSLSISGTVTAIGGTASGASGVSCGVFSYSDSISVIGGTITAISSAVTGGSSQAMNTAPNLNGYTTATVIASTSADGSNPAESYAAESLSTYKYLYLKIGTLYALTVNLNGGSGATVGGNHAAGETVSIDAGTKSGYSFSGWTATGGGTFASASSASTTYTMPASTATITANWTANSTGGGDGGISTTTVSVSGGSDAVNLSASVSGSTATVSATDAQLQKIASGTQTGTIKIDASGLKVDAVVIPAKIVSVLNNAAGTTSLEILLSTGTVTLDETVLATVVGKGDVKLSIETVSNSKLTDTQKAVLGTQAETAFVVDVNVYVNGTRTSTFGDGKISVSVPYKPKSGENTDSITVWFIKDDGTIEPKTASYANGKVTFTTEHLSQYLIVDFPFTDVAESAWYYGSVAYAYNNGLFAGTSDTAFSPDTAMTRQMIWMVLARMDGKTPANMDTARSWAMKSGISDGSNPADCITREQMAAILYRYAQYKGYDVSIGADTNILSYDDALSISEYAIPAIQWTCGAGLMQGSNNNIMPSGSATRTQVATILQRFCKNVAK